MPAPTTQTSACVSVSRGRKLGRPASMSQMGDLRIRPLQRPSRCADSRTVSANWSGASYALVGGRAPIEQPQQFRHARTVLRFHEHGAERGDALRAVLPGAAEKLHGKLRKREMKTGF